jgi:hypothetical protein
MPLFDTKRFASPLEKSGIPPSRAGRYEGCREDKKLPCRESKPRHKTRSLVTLTELSYVLSIYKTCFSFLWSRVSSGSTVSDYGLDDRAIGVRSPAGAKDFSSILCPNRLWGPTILPYNEYQWSFPRG